MFSKVDACKLVMLTVPNDKLLTVAFCIVENNPTSLSEEDIFRLSIENPLPSRIPVNGSVSLPIGSLSTYSKSKEAIRINLPDMLALIFS